MFSSKNKKFSTKKKSYTYGSKENKKILKRIKVSLPELMSRNLKLCQKLNDKLIVSSFMNDTDSKANKYLKKFLFSSQNRVKKIKTGISLLNITKDETKKLEKICNSINDNIIIKNSDFLINEKKLMNENISKEKHKKINKLIKYIIKPNKIKRKIGPSRIIKPVPEEEMTKMIKIINNELNNDENFLKGKINFYKQNLLTLAENDHKKLRKIASDLSLKSDLKTINYTKSSLIKSKTQKMMNLYKIRKHLIKSKEKKGKNDNKEIYNNNYKDDYFDKTKNITYYNNGDTMSIIKKLAKDKNHLKIKTMKNLNRINSMIDIKLPHFSNYQRAIKFKYLLNKNMNATTTDIESKKEPIRYKIKFKSNVIAKLDLIF